MWLWSLAGWPNHAFPLSQKKQAYLPLHSRNFSFLQLSAWAKGSDVPGRDESQWKRAENGLEKEPAHSLCLVAKTWGIHSGSFDRRNEVEELDV